MADRLGASSAPVRLTGLAFVAAAHAAALWGLWQHRLLPSPESITTLFVNFVAPPTPKPSPVPKRPPPPKAKPIEKPQPRQIVAETPVLAPGEPVAPPSVGPAPAPVVEAPTLPLPPGPVTLGGDLALACHERTAPTYPAAARRLGETGTVVLRVELDETGQVAAARVSRPSGHARLDDAALSAVHTWRCTPPRRNGQPVRAVALQPFRFVLQ